MSLPTGVLNFALITKLPHHHLPSLFHVHGVAVSPPAWPRAAPSPLPHPWFLSKYLGPSTWHSLPARTPRTAVDAPRRRTRRAVPCALSPPPYTLGPLRPLWLAQHAFPPSLSTLPLWPKQTEPSSPRPTAMAARHSRRRPCSRGAPTSGLPSPKLSPGIAPLPPPEAPRPLLVLSPSPECRSRGTGPPPAAGARGQATTSHLSPN